MSVKTLSIREWGSTIVIEPVAHWWKLFYLQCYECLNLVALASFPPCIRITSSAVSAAFSIIQQLLFTQRGFGGATTTHIHRPCIGLWIVRQSQTYIGEAKTGLVFFKNAKSKINNDVMVPLSREAGVFTCICLQASLHLFNMAATLTF